MRLTETNPKSIFHFTVARFGHFGQWLTATHRPWRATLLLSPVVLYIAIFTVFVMPRETFLAGDSSTYLMFSNYRTLGYPIILRIMGLIPSYYAFSAIQTLAFIGANLLFVEAVQRIFKNYFFSLPIGFLILCTWNYSYNFFILADSLFYSAVVAQVALTLFVLERSSRIRLVLLAAITVLAISIRPAGMALVLVAPFLLVFVRGRVKTLIWHVVPLSVFVLSLCLAHWYLFGFFGLSAFGGYNTGATTMFLLKRDAPSRHPDLAAALYRAGEPYRHALASEKDCRGRMRYIFAEASPMIDKSLEVTTAYLASHPQHLHPENPERQREFVRWIGRQSRINREIDSLGVWFNANWNSINQVMGDVGREAHIGNPWGALDLIRCKIAEGWMELFTYARVPAEFGGPVMAPESMAKWRVEQFGLSTTAAYPINLSAGIVAALKKSLYGPIALLVGGLAVSALALISLFRRNVPSPEISAACYLFLMVVANLFFVCVGGNPVPRYLFPLLPFTLSVSLLPILLVTYFPNTLMWHSVNRPT